MINISVDETLGKIVIVTDDLSVECFLKKKLEEKKYLPWKKSYGITNKVEKIYDSKKKEKGIITFRLGLGWAGYIITVLGTYITREEYDNILRNIYSENPRDIPFPELRDYQNSDILHLLKFKRGLVSVYTSYGKTQSISVLANYLHSIGKRVLIVAPGKKAMEELVKRCKSLYNLDIPSQDLSINCIITSGLLNRNDIKDLNERAKFETLMKTYDAVLVDEVEYTINPSGEYLFSTLCSAERFYAFSGTADKVGGEMISFVNGLSEVVMNNKDLVKWFGPSLIHRMPLSSIKVDYIAVRTSCLDLVKFEPDDFKTDSNIYLNIMNRIWTDPYVCRLIVQIAKKYPKLFIPINNLTSILTEWIDNYFIGKFRILLVCAEGFIYYDLEGNKTKLNLSESCEKIKNNEVDIIPSTSSGYRALDFPNLENILLIQGKVAGVVLQSVGRVARGKHMNIITLESKSDKNIPVFTKGCAERNEMIHGYYKYCEVVDSVIYEEQLNKED